MLYNIIPIKYVLTQAFVVIIITIQFEIFLSINKDSIKCINLFDEFLIMKIIKFYINILVLLVSNTFYSQSFC